MATILSGKLGRQREQISARLSHIHSQTAATTSHFVCHRAHADRLDRHEQQQQHEHRRRQPDRRLLSISSQGNMSRQFGESHMTPRAGPQRCWCRQQRQNKQNCGQPARRLVHASSPVHAARLDREAHGAESATTDTSVEAATTLVAGNITSGRGVVTNIRSSPPALLLLVVALCSLASMTIFAPTLVNGIRLQPEGREKFYWSGEQFVITCQNNNNIKNVKIRWIGPDGSFVTENRSQRIHAESSGPHGHRLVVMNATLGRDEGVYNCTIGSADNRTPLETAQFALHLLRETNFKDTPKRLTLTAGQRGHIDCAVEFDPGVSTGTVSWLKNSQPIEHLGDPSIQALEYNPDRQLSQLLLAPVKREHEDEYTCQATAITPHLSRLLEYKIQVETHYAPAFDAPEQTVWVESQQAMAARLHQAGGAASAGSASTLSSTQQQQQTVAHRNIFGPANGQRGRSGRPRPGQQQQQQSAQEGELQQVAAANEAQQQVISVELRCTVQANPEASIVWTTRSLQGRVVQRGQPAHVLKEPASERSGHNTTSVLTVAYNLDPEWEFKRDTYTCSAMNKLGETKKVFTIEQGNPPPAFLVNPASRTYNPETAQFAFTLLGPQQAHPAAGGAGADAASEVVPPVDSFRIRAEPGSGGGGGAGGLAPMADASQSANGAMAGQTGARANQVDSRLSYSRRQSEPSVQWTYRPTGTGAQNVTVNLSKLPSGTQRLYLEAHNAVGWSPNATNLGEFYLVSGSSSSQAADLLVSSYPTLIVMALCQIAAAWRLLPRPHHS